ncbi:TKL protein kinase [Thecamonas trahens ATCC 50062]|uniref:TKL protein kinase n=1 Tax=Thecamonas trahens ATCC 50062 TaxID=461836 RepID=A0A0L0DMY1_THETB|nr:TKL protein kinase [Thecamonas trahens ATCC 50062]KNC52773.1 TKL protein kinase [Thecamonas trahens ATCC 50062]|eukprot:XP_013755085.1 TKL protein kinase [Thecamonas trahens ATCC 50062]
MYSYLKKPKENKLVQLVLKADYASGVYSAPQPLTRETAITEWIESNGLPPPTVAYATGNGNVETSAAAIKCSYAVCPGSSVLHVAVLSGWVAHVAAVVQAGASVGETGEWTFNAKVTETGSQLNAQLATAAVDPRFAFLFERQGGTALDFARQLETAARSTGALRRAVPGAASSVPCDTKEEDLRSAVRMYLEYVESGVGDAWLLDTTVEHEPFLAPRPSSTYAKLGSSSIMAPPVARDGAGASSSSTVSGWACTAPKKAHIGGLPGLPSSLAVVASDALVIDPDAVLGRGGFGVVYKGRMGERDVAVKRIIDMTPAGREDLEREVKAMYKLKHANIVAFLGVFDASDDTVMIVMEFVPFGSLRHVVDQGYEIGSPLDVATCLSLALGIARGMAYLHACEPPILHMDLKALNVLVGGTRDAPVAKVSDFGLARMLATSGAATTSVGGTMVFMPPEAMATPPRPRRAWDVYAFGITLFELTTGRWPYMGLGLPLMFIMHLIANGHRPSVDAMDGHPVLQALAQRCWTHEPSDRPTFEAIVAELE